MKKHFFLILFIFFVIKTSAQINLNNGLIASYSFNNNANDASGNNYNGILSNGVGFTTDRTGSTNSAAYFDGIDDYIEITNNGVFSPRNGFSFVPQFKTESSVVQTLIGKHDLATGTDAQLQTFINGDQQPGFGYGHECSNNTNFDQIILQYYLYVSTGINTIELDKWYCVIGVFDGISQNIYLNGVLMASKPAPLLQIDSCSNIPLTIDRHTNDYFQSFKGAMDEVRVYNRALTNDEINLLSPCKVVTTEICNNGLDDDGDGLIDCADPDCLSCTSPCGPVPSINPKIFNTANDGQGGLIPLGSTDLHWKVSDVLNGTPRDAIYTGNCVPGYWTPSPFPDAGWIVDGQYGVCGVVYPQNSQTPRYYSTTFNVPASLASSLKLSFDVYADNYVGEVYLNGVPQGISKTASDVFCTGCNISFTINSGFVAGTNTLTILVLQLPLPESPPAQYMGFLLNASSTLDSDGDSVPDGKDLCPDTPPGVSVDENGCFKISITKKSSLCKGDSLILESSDAGTGSNYQWITPAGQSITGKKIVISNLSLTSEGKYRLEITNSYNCIHNDSLDIVLNPKPIINLSSDYTICQGSSVQLSASGGNIFHWYPPSDLNNSTIPNPLASPTTTTTYKVIVANSFGCTDSSLTTITVNTKPIITVTPDTSICTGKSIQLNAGGGINYQWSPDLGLNNSSIASPVATPVFTTNYKVLVFGNNGCKDSAITTVTVNQPPAINLQPKFNICANDSAQLLAGGGINYQWHPSTGLNKTDIPNPKAFPSNSTNYQVIVTTASGCIDSAQTIVQINPVPLIEVQKSNDIDCSMPTAALTIKGAKEYTWKPSQYLNSTNTSTVIASPDHTTIFIVDWKDANDCIGSDSIKVDVTNSGNILYLLPNSFTPNSDGINDCFGLKKWGGITLTEFSIFNRWGQKVFTTNDPTQCWDGSFKGQSQPIGTFVYYVKAKTFCGDIFRKGTVTIIR